MKKIVMTALSAVFAISAVAQDLQLHYDFGRNIYSDELPERQKLTLTLEHFSVDGLGSWYYFVDLSLIHI